MTVLVRMLGDQYLGKGEGRMEVLLIYIVETAVKYTSKLILSRLQEVINNLINLQT